MKDVVKKWKFKTAGLVIHAPAALEKEFVKIGFSTSLDKKAKSSNVLVFINNNKEFISFLSKQLKNVEHDAVLWFAYPKGTSGIKTDINRDTLRTTAESFGITTVAAISIDETWSGLRFRPIDKVGK